MLGMLMNRLMDHWWSEWCPTPKLLTTHALSLRMYSRKLWTTSTFELQVEYDAYMTLITLVTTTDNCLFGCKVRSDSPISSIYDVHLSVFFRVTRNMDSTHGFVSDTPSGDGHAISTSASYFVRNQGCYLRWNHSWVNSIMESKI
jgi:hypothetical protein